MVEDQGGIEPRRRLAATPMGVERASKTRHKRPNGNDKKLAYRLKTLITGGTKTAARTPGQTNALELVALLVAGQTV